MKSSIDNIKAYILQPPEENKDHIVTWLCSTEVDNILNAPIDDVIFVDEDDKNHNIARQKMIDRLNIDPHILKHKNIFNIFQRTYPHNYIIINTQPTLVTSGYIIRDNAMEFANYLRDSKKTINYDSSINYMPSDTKDKLNKVGIYIKPTKKLFEYNPVLAKRQYKLRHSKKKKSPIKYDLLCGDLESLKSEFERILSYNIDLTIKYREGSNSSRRKNGISYCILILIDFYNMFFQKNSYRNFETYKKIITLWKNTPEEKRKLYPKEFIKWINAEAKIKLKPKKQEQYWIHKKPKLSIFKISKLQWTRK